MGEEVSRSRSKNEKVSRNILITFQVKLVHDPISILLNKRFLHRLAEVLALRLQNSWVSRVLELSEKRKCFPNHKYKPYE
jgi:hypothetical protein